MAVWAAITGFLKALPEMVALFKRLVDGMELIALEARQKRLDKDLKDGISDAKTTANMQKLEGLWGKKF